MRQLQKNTSIFLFVVLTTILIITSFLSYSKLKQFEASANSVVHTSIIKNTLTEILTNLINAETGQRGFLLTGDSVFLDSYKGAELRINFLLTFTNTLIKENDFEYKDLKTFKELITSRLQYLKVNMELIQTHPPKSISDIALIKGKYKMDQVRRHAAIMLHMEDKVLLQRIEYKNRTASVTPFFILTLSLLSAFFLTLFFIRLQKETNNRISLIESNRQLQEAKKQIETSEKKLQDIFRQAPVIIAVFSGENFKVEVINEFALEVLGKSEEVVMGKPFFEISPNLKQTLEPFFKNVFDTGKPLIVKEYFVEYLRNGKPVSNYFNFINQVMRNEQNEITGIITIAISVTESVVARKEIEESEEKFRGLAETLPHLVWITDDKGEAIYASEKWLEYSGLNPYESENWQIVVHPDDMEQMTLAWTTSLATGKKYSAEARLKDKHGNYRWHMVEGVPLKNKEEKILKWIGAFIDIQDQKTKEQLKDDFISIASHEMKTPLTTAKGYINLLQLSLSEENETAILYANKANQSVDRLQSLVTELLEVSKIQNGKLNYNITTFDFNTMVDETIENFQLIAQNHLLLISGKCVHPITGDRERLQQVLINLLSNAIKYSPLADKILINIEEKDSEIQVSVRDFGIGMSTQHLDKIFDRYYRVHDHAIQFQGLGMGLYISNSIIERHKGIMWAISELEKGSTFYFKIPV